MNPAELLAGMKRTVEQLAAFNDIAKALTSTLEVREVISLAMQKVSQLLSPSQWSLLLHDPTTDRLYFEIAVGEGAEELKKVTLSAREGIAGAVFTTGEPRLVVDVGRDPTFLRRFEARTKFQTRSIMAAPLKFKGRVLGVIEILKSANDVPFSNDDLVVLMGMADYVAIAIENARTFQRVQELTITDEHTGLFNARHLLSVLEAEVARARRFGHPLSMIFGDIDRFKQVNDSHGHLVGSATLREVGQILLGCVRQVDPVFRYGGDEFAVLLIETDAGGAQRSCERICQGFRERRFLADRGLNLEITASLGYATFPDHADTGLELLKAADEAMYRAKAAGRNGLQGASRSPGASPAPPSTQL